MCRQRRRRQAWVWWNSSSSSDSKQVCAGHTRIPGRCWASHLLLHVQMPLWARAGLPCGEQFCLLPSCLSQLLLQRGTALPAVQGPARLPDCSAWLFDGDRKRVERKCHLDSLWARLGTGGSECCASCSLCWLISERHVDTSDTTLCEGVLLGHTRQPGQAEERESRSPKLLEPACLLLLLLVLLCG